MGRHLLRRKDVIIAIAAVFLFLQALLPAQTISNKTSQIPSTQPQSTIQEEKRIPFDIPVPSSGWAQESIDKYRKQFLTPFGKQQLCKILDDGETYRLYVRRELKKRNMPASLEYLPVVESDYNPLAQSKSGAAGIWQFMTNSISPFLKKNEWIDERFDPWKSTDAALSKLQDNYKMFGDWPIAIAAYNCGAGAMKRILKKSPVKTFWYIAEHGLLRDQSVQYVPKFLAISDLASNGQYYKISLPEISKTTRFAEFDSIITTSSITISRLSAELRLYEDSLEILNPALIKGCTPPDFPYELRLPSGMGNAAETALNSIFASSKTKEELAIHCIVKGETLWSISREQNCSVDDICELNGIKKTDILSIGEEIFVPKKKNR